MTLLEEIQNSTIDGKSDLSEVLRKCKLLAARLHSQPLEDWLVWESNGYPQEATVPEYRIWRLEVFGNFAGPFGSGIRNAPIPLDLLSFLPDKTKESYRRYQCRESIAAIEATLGASKTGRVAVSTGNLAVVNGTKLYQTQNCMQTWAQFEKGRLVEVANAVRNRVLDFALAIGEESPNAGETGSNAPETIEPSKVTQIFYATVHGSSANIVGAATASPVTFNIGTKDFSALERVLGDKSVSAEDIDELKTALDTDPAPLTYEKFEPNVSS